MKRTIVVLALTAAGLLTACDAPNLSAPNDPSGLHLRLDEIRSHTDSHNQPWPFSELNPCNGDVISGLGLAHYRFDSSFDTNGKSTINNDTHGEGTGTGDPSGNNYLVKLHSTDERKNERPPSPAFSIKQKVEWNVKGPTKADGYKLVHTFEWVVDNSGVTKKLVDKTTFKCGN